MPAVWEIICHALVNILPFVTLALLPFRNHLRLPIRWIVGLFITLCAISGLLSWLALCFPGSAAWLTVLSVFLYFGSYIFAVRAKPLKLLAVLMILLNYASLATVTANFLLFSFSPGRISHPYSAQYTIFYALGLLAAYPFYYKTLKESIRPQIELGDNEQVWTYLWGIPATFCAVNYYCLFSAGSVAAFSKSFWNTLFFWAIHTGGLLTLYMIQRFLEEARKNLQLQEENNQFILQAAQYENLKKNIEEARRAQHDMRHHFTIIQDCISKNDLSALSDYMAKYQQDSPGFDEGKPYCSNYAVDAVLRFYAGKAAQNQTKIHIAVEMEQTLLIPEPEFCVLLGNLLENALECCAGQEYAAIQAHIMQHSASILTITVDNTCPNPPAWENGKLCSSKHKGFGLGTASVSMVAQRYHGGAQFQWKNGIFYASVLLSPDD